MKNANLFAIYVVYGMIMVGFDVIAFGENVQTDSGEDKWKSIRVKIAEMDLRIANKKHVLLGDVERALGKCVGRTDNPDGNQNRLYKFGKFGRSLLVVVHKKTNRVLSLTPIYAYYSK